MPDWVIPGSLIAALPWAFIALLAPLAMRRRPIITEASPFPEHGWPHVSIIVPARNEAQNIGRCIAGLLGSTYPEKEIIVVDDRSDDGTYEIVGAFVERGHGEVALVSGQPLPSGWFGKNWACWQGVQQAKGDLLLFTDADTKHDPMLLGHAVATLEEQQAGLVSVLPLQLLESFWERVIMPHILVMIGLRYRDLSRINRSKDPRNVIGNGQFLLFNRKVYEDIGGHEVVRGSVVEDLRLAQITVERGHRLFVAHADKLMQTRMYRSLGGIIEGWSKNLSTGAKMTVAPWLAPFVAWGVALYQLVIWVLPAALLTGWVFGYVNRQVGEWALFATLFSLMFWIVMCVRLRVLPRYAFFYPIGALATVILFLRSALRGDRVVWKGRAYRAGEYLDPLAAKKL
jgi:cellulose synthase/poly-beta-1,6-N-acetylglucosamine synthase-like glycosyltransferase